MARLRDFKSYDVSEPETTTFGQSEDKAVSTFEPLAEPVCDATPADVPVSTSSESKTAVEKIVKPLKDLTPKYTVAAEAVASIIKEGSYYEDYQRAESAGLLSDKEFVLTALAQDYSRFYAPQTPKPHDWYDEEYLTARVSFFFEETKEGIKPEANAELADNLYNFLLKQSFAAEAYDTVIEIAKRIARVNAAKIMSKEDGDRMRESLAKFNTALNDALSIAKNKYAQATAAAEEKQKSLSEQKKGLTDFIDEMQFSI